MLLLGCEYENNRLLRAIRFPEPDLVQFGKVMSEANRYKILEMLLERGELCTADIAKEWDTSVTLVYYHLEMMSSTGLQVPQCRPHHFLQHQCGIFPPGRRRAAEV